MSEGSPSTQSESPSKSPFKSPYKSPSSHPCPPPCPPQSPLKVPIKLSRSPLKSSSMSPSKSHSKSPSSSTSKPPSKSPSPLPCVAPHHKSSLHKSVSPSLPPPPNKKCPPPPPPRLTPLLSLASSPHPSHCLSGQGPPQPSSLSAYPRFVFQHHPPESYQPPVQAVQPKSVKFVSFSQQ